MLPKFEITSIFIIYNAGNLKTLLSECKNVNVIIHNDKEVHFSYYLS